MGETVDSQRQYILFLEKKIYKMKESIELLKTYCIGLEDRNQDLIDLIDQLDQEARAGDD
jgi:hypothetical protein